MSIAFIHRWETRFISVAMTYAKMLGIVDWYRFDPGFAHPLTTPPRALLKAISIPHHSLYLVEGGFGLIIGALKKSLGEKCKIIMLANDPTFYSEWWRGLGRTWRKFLVGKIDGVIAVSKMVYKDVKRQVDVPVKVAYPPILKKREFFSLKPNFKSRDLIFVGNCEGRAGYIKGADLLLETFKILKKKEPELKLYMVGRALPEMFSKLHLNGLFLPGETDPTKYLPNAMYYIHLARYDAFPVAVIEASLAGLIPLVSSTTGTKEFVETVNPSLILNDLKPDAIAKKVLEVRSMKENDLKKLSIRFKKAALEYVEKKHAYAFKKAFWELVHEFV